MEHVGPFSAFPRSRRCRDSHHSTTVRIFIHFFRMYRSSSTASRDDLCRRHGLSANKSWGSHSALERVFDQSPTSVLRYWSQNIARLRPKLSETRPLRVDASSTASPSVEYDSHPSPSLQSEPGPAYDWTGRCLRRHITITHAVAIHRRRVDSLGRK